MVTVMVLDTISFIDMVDVVSIGVDGDDDGVGDNDDGDGIIDVADCVDPGRLLRAGNILQ